tara:strand:- start:1392 stop:1682 length:291 start_codon:yes stop_codon:yes gene_type:complete
MSNPELQLGLMKLLSTKHFPLQSPRRKVKLAQLEKAMEKIGSPTERGPLFENLCELKGRGYVNTIPKIILKEEAETAEFEVWLTPLGRTELQKKLA